MRMYTRFVTAFAAVAAFSAAAPVQAQDDDLIARVPFEFSVGAGSLPRDTYRISRMNGHPEMLMLRGDRKGVFVRTEEMRVRPDGAMPSLTFHRYGDQYFLREIRLEGSTRLDLPETRAEREAAEGHADRLAAGMETVVISGTQR